MAAESRVSNQIPEDLGSSGSSSVILQLCDAGASVS